MIGKHLRLDKLPEVLQAGLRRLEILHVRLRSVIECPTAAGTSGMPNSQFTTYQAYIPFTQVGALNTFHHLGLQPQATFSIFLKAELTRRCIATQMRYLLPLLHIKRAALVGIAGATSQGLCTSMVNSMENSTATPFGFQIMMTAYREEAERTMKRISVESFSQHLDEKVYYMIDCMSTAVYWAKEYKKKAAQLQWSIAHPLAHAGVMSIITDLLNDYAATTLSVLNLHTLLPSITKAKLKWIYEHLYRAIRQLYLNVWVGMTHHQRATLHAMRSNLAKANADFISSPGKNILARQVVRKLAPTAPFPIEVEEMKECIRQARYACLAHEVTAKKLVD